MKLSKRVVIPCTAVALMGIAVGGRLAYLSANQTVTNTFTVGKVEIDVTEENYPGNDSEEVKDLVPNEEVKKDPKITNTGTNDAVAFLKVSVPTAEFKKIAADGTPDQAAAVHPLFMLIGEGQGDADAEGNKFNSPWLKLNEEDFEDEDGKTYRVYTFGYPTVLEGATANDLDGQTDANKMTATLFDKVKLANCAEGVIEPGAAQNIKVDAYAIQSDYINDIDTSGTMDANKLNQILTVFLNQNPDLVYEESKPQAEQGSTNDVNSTGSVDAYNKSIARKIDFSYANTKLHLNGTQAATTVITQGVTANVEAKDESNAKSTGGTWEEAKKLGAKDADGTEPEVFIWEVSRVDPLNGDDAKVTYVSSNPAIVEVAADGTITAKKVGSAVITATHKYKNFNNEDKSVSASINVTVE